MFQPTKEWVNKVNLSSFELKNFFRFVLEWLAREKKKHFDVTTMFTYSQANTPLGQSERAYCLSYFIKYLSKIYFHLRWLHKSGPRIFLNHCFSGIFLLLRSNTSWWIPRKKWSTAGSLLAFYFVLESVVLTLTGSVIQFISGHVDIFLAHVILTFQTIHADHFWDLELRVYMRTAEAVWITVVFLNLFSAEEYWICLWVPQLPLQPKNATL